MQNLINHYTRKSYTPPFYHRQINNDIENEENTLSRISKIGFQFIFLYKPAASLCNSTLSSIRVVSNFSKLIKRIENQDFDEKVFSDAYATSLSMVSLAGTYFNFTIGLYLTTLNDILLNILQIYNALCESDFEKAFELTLQAMSSTLYIGIMITGSLEVILASLIVQALLPLLQSSKEFKKGRYLETVANVFLSALKISAANDQLQIIKKRNALLQIKKFNDIKNRIQKSKDIDELYDHPLIKLIDKVSEKSVIIKDSNDNEIDFGAHFFGYGQKHVKGMNLSFKQDKDHIELEFKVNHVFRDKLAKLTAELKSCDTHDLNELLKIYGSNSDGISFSQKDSLNTNSYYKPQDIVINLKNIGSLSIGKSENITGLYDRVQVRLAKTKNLYDLHEILSFFDLSDVLKASVKEDMERMKIGQVFRMCCPKVATILERSDDFFDLPLEQLKQKIIKLAPDMKDNLIKYLPRLELREILPGKMRYAIKGLSDELYELGARNLTAAITGAHQDEEVCNRIVSMFKMGALSLQTRYYANMMKNGLSPMADFESGGADSVFTQIVTENNQSYNDMWYTGKARLVYSLKALDTISYQYRSDSFGSRNLNYWWWGADYLNRPNIFNFVKDQMNHYNGNNEVMVKERIPPEYIEGIVVESNSLKNKIINALDKASFITVDELGNKSIFGKAVDSFIQVGNSITSS